MNRNTPKQTLILFAIAAALTLCIGFGVSGCIKHIPTDTPAITFQRTILAGADAADALSVALVGANKTVNSLGDSGQLSSAEVADIHGYLTDVARANDLALDALQLARTTGDTTSWQSALLKVAQAVSKRDPATFKLKSADAQAAFRISLNAIITAAQAIQRSYGQ